MLLSIKYKLSSGLLVNQIRPYLSTNNLLTRAVLFALKKLLAFCVFTGMVLMILFSLMQKIALSLPTYNVPDVSSVIEYIGMFLSMSIFSCLPFLNWYKPSLLPINIRLLFVLKIAKAWLFLSAVLILSSLIMPVLNSMADTEIWSLSE